MISHCNWPWTPQFLIFRYNSDGNPAHNTIEELEASDNEESLYDNVPKRNSGSKKFRRSRGQTEHLRPSPPTGSRKKRGSRKSSGGSTIDRVRYAKEPHVGR